MAEPLIVSEVVVFVVPWSSQNHSIVSENHVYAVLQGSAPSRSESPNAIWAKKAYVPDEASSCDVDAQCNDRTVVASVAFAWTMGASVSEMI